VRARDSEHPPPSNQAELLLPINGGSDAPAPGNHPRRSQPDGRHAIPADWSPDPHDRRYALERGYDERWIDEQAQAAEDGRSTALLP